MNEKEREIRTKEKAAAVSRSGPGLSSSLSEAGLSEQQLRDA